MKEVFIESNDTSNCESRINVTFRKMWLLVTKK